VFDAAAARDALVALVGKARAAEKSRK